MYARESKETRQKIENLAGIMVDFLTLNEQNHLRLEIAKQLDHPYKTVKCYICPNSAPRLSCQGNSYPVVGIAPPINISDTIVRLNHPSGRYIHLPNVRKIIVKIGRTVFAYISNCSRTERKNEIQQYNTNPTYCVYW